MGKGGGCNHRILISCRNSLHDFVKAFCRVAKSTELNQENSSLLTPLVTNSETCYNFFLD